MEINLGKFKEKHVKVSNVDGLLEISAKRITRSKTTGARIERFFYHSEFSPELKGATHVFSDGKLIITPRKELI